MKNSFAQKYWKEFELLAINYIQDQYKDFSAKCIHTSFIGDGGYDGSISSNLTKNNSPFIHEILSLIEAKLRTESNINIHDFAASIIAAYNASANILYVVSNKNFTKETYNITNTFSNKVNLRICLVDGKYILNWLKNQKVPSNKRNFYKKLIASIEEKNSEDNEINTNFETNDKKNSFEDILPGTTCIHAEEIYGEKVCSIKKEICTLLKDTRADYRLAVLYGQAGTGKSALLSNIGQDLQQNDFLFSILDGDSEEAKSIRTIYLWVLRAIWGIDPTKIYSAENVSEFVYMICVSAGIEVDISIHQTITEIFDCSSEQLIAKSDLYTAYLLRYLEQILEKEKEKIVVF